MKHLLTILCVLTSFTALAQFPNTHGQSNSHTKEVFYGAANPRGGLINGRYADTAAANLDYVAGEAGAQIVVGNTIYLRDNTATKWIVAGGYGVIASNITILNDSSISICNGSTCDTFSFTNIVVNNFSVVNDSTILVCDGNNVCDTLFIPPTPISKNFVDSTKIRGGDSLFYYINGNEYLGGVISPKSTISILNDSSLVICSSIKCDTFTFNNIVINSFTVVNDSTILVCDGNNVCDTLNIPPTPIAKSYVDSTKIIDGVIYYYINGNAYSGGAVTTSAQYQWSVLDSLSTVASPAQGDVYLVSTAPSGSFVGHANQIAQYDTTAGFTFTSPNVGDLLYNSTTYQVSKWTGTAWVVQPPPLVENWWSRTAWNGAPGQYIQTGAKNSYLTMFGSLNGTNTGLGRQVFTDIPSGGLGGNTAIGNSSQFHIGAGAYNNTSMGHYSLWYAVSGHDQVAIGFGALNTGDKAFSIGLGTNAANNNNTFSISDSTTHLHMKLDSASGVAPSVIGKDANGNWHTYQTPSGSSGSGNTKYVLQGWGIKIDSSGNNYTVAVDSTLLKDSLYAGRGIKVDTTTYPNHTLLVVDSNYVRDTSLHLNGGTTGQVLKKNSSTNGDWSWQDESGGGSCDTCVVHFALSSDSTKLYPILQNGDSLPYINWLGTTVDTLPLHNQIVANAANIATNTTNIATNTTAIATKANNSNTVTVNGNTQTLGSNPSFTIGSGATVSSYGKNASKDSTIITLSDGTRFAAKDSVGSGSSGNDSLKIITAVVGTGSATLTNTNGKGILLRDTTTSLSSHNSPPIILQARAASNPFYYKIMLDNSALFRIQYSLDSINWSGAFTINKFGDIVSGLLSPTGINTAGYQGTLMNLRADLGSMLLGNGSRVANPLSLWEGVSTTRGGLLIPISTTNKNKLTTGIYRGTITNAGSGGTNGNYTQLLVAVTGSGSGQSASLVVSGGAVTSITPSFGTTGSGYKVGDIVTVTGIAGLTGFAYRVDRLTGDTAIGLQVTDTTMRQSQTWNGEAFQGDMVTSSASTLNLSHGVDYIFTGTTATYTLPPVNSIIGRNNRITIKNRGSGSITLNSDTGNTIYSTSAVGTITIAAGAACELLPGSTYFNVLYNQ